MRKVLLLSLVFVSLYSQPPYARALDGNTGASSEGQAQISLTIPERLEVLRNPQASRAAKGSDQLHVRSNFADSGFKYSLKRVVFSGKRGPIPGAGTKRGSQLTTQHTQVFVVLPE